MSYELTRADLGSISDVEMAFSTDRLLPAWDEIPEDFRCGNLYTKVAEAIFYSTALPDAEIHFRAGFADDTAQEDLNRCLRAHLQSWGPKHEHKIAGVGFMIACVCELRAPSVVTA